MKNSNESFFKAYYVYFKDSQFHIGDPIIINMNYVVKFTKYPTTEQMTTPELMNKTIYLVDTVNDHTAHPLRVVSNFLDEQMKKIHD